MHKKRVHYVNNKDFYDAIVKYKETVAQAKKEGKEIPRIPDYIGECIMMIAKKLSTKPCFLNYSFREEMISDGIENSILYFHDYNPDFKHENSTTSTTPNPFAYFTQIIYFAFLRRISKEEKNRYIIYKNFQETYTTMDSLMVDSEDNKIISTTLYDNINVFMEKFEHKEAQKKRKRKDVKNGLTKFLD